jgi:tetratricopeptide (TPR) repeat protein
MTSGNTTRTLTLSPRRVCWVLLILGFVVLFVVQRQIDNEQGVYAKISDVLYVKNGKNLRLLSLGNEALLADIYWTRVVQYFGRAHMEKAGGRFELLAPLLRICTDLDPHLLIAYRFGAIFLTGNPPVGAGDPQEALELLRRGIVANPDYWRLWQDLGFVYYWDLKDYKTAAKIFAIGGERPGASYWMKAMAGTIAAKGGDLQTSHFLWSQIYRDAETDAVRRTATEHLAAIVATEQMGKLNEVLAAYEAKQGHPAHSFYEVYASGLLRGLPKDPSGAPFVIGPDGRATLGPGSTVLLVLLR